LLVTVHGSIRNHEGGQSVNYLAYSLHPRMQDFLKKIIFVEEVRTRSKLFAVHRVGPLQIGNATLVTALSAADR